MRYTMPYYYNKFKCVADKCPDSCCAGWAIVIDRKTMNKYKKLPKADRKYVMSHVDKKEGIFRQNGCRCSFLNKDNLCDLIINKGEEMLCKTCDRYPRHFEEYGNLVEAALSMSCPIAAEMIMDKENTWQLKSRTDGKMSPHANEVDEKLVDVLQEIRSTIFNYLKKNTKNFHEAIRVMLVYVEKIQVILYQYEQVAMDDNGNWIDSGESGDELLKALREVSVNELELELSSAETEDINRYDFFAKVMDMLLGLEPISADWNQYIVGVKKQLYEVLTKDEYNKKYSAFQEYMNDNICEKLNILLYYIYTYFLGAVYDMNALGMMKFAILSMYIVEELEFSKWLINGMELSFDERVHIAYKYSRQMEHSDNNLLSMEGLLTAHPMFSVENFCVL